MYPSTPIGALTSESGLIPAHILLDFRQRKYAYRLLSLPDSISTKVILLITLRTGDEHARFEDQPEGDGIWASHQKVKSYGQHLACQVTVGFCVDPADRVKLVGNLEQEKFLGKISIREPKAAISDTDKNRSDLALWSDGSRLESGKVGGAVVWKNSPVDSWKSCKLAIGKNKEVLDPELWSLSEALSVALKETALRNSYKVTVFSDSQTAIRKLQGLITGRGQALKAQIVKRTKLLQARDSEVTIQWIPSHSKVEENERVDIAAKETATKGKATVKWNSLAYIKRSIREAKTSEILSWYQTKNNEREARNRSYYVPRLKPGIQPALGQTPKKYAIRFFQLRVGHAATDVFLERIRKREIAECMWCGRADQLVVHLYTRCRKWRKERRVLKKRA